MKNILLLLFFVGGWANAQTVTIPDPLFKAALLSGSEYITDSNYDPVDLDPDLDGEIQLSDALNVTSIALLNLGFSDITGIQEFANLEYLNVVNNNIGNLDLSGMTNLKTFYGNQNPFTSVVVDGLPNLDYFEISNAPLLEAISISNCDVLQNVWSIGCDNLQTVTVAGLPMLNALVVDYNPNLETVDASNCPMLITFQTDDANNIKTLNLSGDTGFTDLGSLTNMHALENLDVSNCVNLQLLWIDGLDNALQNINMTNCPALWNLVLSGAKFTTIDLSVVPNLTYLSLSHGRLESLDVTGFNAPIAAFADHNRLQSVTVDDTVESLDVSNNLLTSLDLSAGTSLDQVICTNNPMTYLNLKNGRNESSLDINNFTLQYVCADAEQVDQIEGLLPASVAVSDYCTFVPGADYNTVTGTIRYDTDYNGCAADDLPVSYIRLEMTDGIQTQTTFTSNGQYNFFATSGTYTITPHFEDDTLYAITPNQATVNFTALGNGETRDFCIGPNGAVADLELSLAPTNAARPGFDANYILVLKNKGNVAQSGTIVFNFDDNAADFVSANAAPTLQTDGTLSWNFNDLLPLQTQSINLTLNLNGPTETPPLLGGNSWVTTASAGIPEGEVTPADNSFSVTQTLVNSQDPNTKTCLEGDILSAQQIGGYLHYNINFENIGTADAINVIVKDVIDATQFDINSLQLLYASHPVYTRINNNVVEFIFENINLPPSMVDPIGGHGNVLFKIKTLPDVQTGDFVENTADIFFDYNHPVTTNTARTTFETLKRSEFSADASVSIHPNPVKNVVTIEAGSTINSVQLYDVQGRLLQTALEHADAVQLDVANRPSGLYFLKVATQRGSQVFKLVKE